MLLVSWIYIFHNLIITVISLEMLKQLFYLKVTLKQSLAYIVWIQIMFVISDVFIQANFPLEYKYPFIFLGFTLGYYFFIKLPFISSIVVMFVNLIVNGISTNFNILVLTLTQFESYGEALDSHFIQYTSLVMVMAIIYMLIKTFDVHILDIKRYN